MTGQRMRRRRDSTLELRFETGSRKELTRWILSRVPHVKVLAPRELRERVRKRLRKGWTEHERMSITEPVQFIPAAGDHLGG